MNGKQDDYGFVDLYHQPGTRKRPTQSRTVGTHGGIDVGKNLLFGLRTVSSPGVPALDFGLIGPLC